MPRILLTQAIHPLAQAQLAALGDVVVAPDTAVDTLRRGAQGCDVIVVRAQLPDDIFDAAPTLIGAVRHGVGVDMIPIDAASSHGVLVANLPGTNAGAVAEHVLRSLLALARHSGPAAARLRSRSAGWLAARAFADRGHELGGKVLGLVGFGHVGQAIARVCKEGLRMQVLAHTRSGASAADSVRAVSLPELLAGSDCVVLACPLTPATRGLIGAAELAAMRPGAYLVNVARGPVVVEAALLDALRSGHLAGAALDVFDQVPLPDAHPFWEMDQVLITPHVAGITDDSMLRMGRAAVQAVESLLHGEVPPHCVNPEAAAAFKRRVAART